MRLTVSSLRRVFNRNLRIEFGPEKLTSYAGLEMVGRFLRRLEFARRVREAFASEALGGDYGTGRLLMVRGRIAARRRPATRASSVRR